MWQRNPSGPPLRRRGIIRSMAGLALVGTVAGCGRKADPQLPSPAPARTDPEPAEGAPPS